MRILLTGVTGQVGSALASRLSKFATVIAADRTMLELSRPQRLPQELDAISPDLIVNPAAYTAVDDAEDNKEMAFVVNGKSPGVIAQWGAARGVPLIHFSTDYVFDGSGTQAWREDDPLAPLNAYGQSKRAGEDAIEAAAGPHLIVRTSWIYAARGKNFFRTMAALMQKREELSIVADQYGAPTSAAAVADAVAEIVRGNSDRLAAAFASAKGKVHVAAQGTTTWFGFAEAIRDGLTRRHYPIVTRRLVPIASADYPTKAVRPLNSRLDISRLADVFQIRPKAWDVLLEDVMDEFAKGDVQVDPAQSARTRP